LKIKLRRYSKVLCREAGIRAATNEEFAQVCSVMADLTLLKVGRCRFNP
jgi:hypothetical protein